MSHLQGWALDVLQVLFIVLQEVLGLQLFVVLGGTISLLYCFLTPCGGTSTHPLTGLGEQAAREFRARAGNSPVS